MAAQTLTLCVLIGLAAAIILMIRKLAPVCWLILGRGACGGYRAARAVKVGHIPGTRGPRPRRVGYEIDCCPFC